MAETEKHPLCFSPLSLSLSLSFSPIFSIIVSSHGRCWDHFRWYPIQMGWNQRLRIGIRWSQSHPRPYNVTPWVLEASKGSKKNLYVPDNRLWSVLYNVSPSLLASVHVYVTRTHALRPNTLVPFKDSFNHKHWHWTGRTPSSCLSQTDCFQETITKRA